MSDSRADQLSDTESDFVEASHEAALLGTERDRRRRRRLERLLGATVVALVVALLAAALAVRAQSEADDRADDADLARLVSLSQSLVATKRDLAALLAVAASEREPGPVTDGALLSAVYADPSVLADIRPGVV